MRSKFERLIFIIYLCEFIVLALSIALFQPLADTPPLYGNPPDEHARYLVPKYICEHGILPTGLEEEIRIPGYGFSYGLYNVFPYIIQGYVMRLVSLFTASEVALLYSARMVNVVFGVCMAIVVWLIGKRIFKDARFRWLFCFAVMYLPESLFMHTYINTDSCCMLSTAMMVYALLSCYQDGINRTNSLWMSGGIILCALSYYNAYGYILSCIFLFLAYFLEKKNGKWSYDWRNMLKKGIFIGGIVLVGISWWFIRSYIVLDGDLLGLATRDKLASEYAVESVNPLYSQSYQEQGYTIGEMMEENNMLEVAYYSFVAAFGSMSIYETIWFYRLYKIFFGAGIVGCACLLLQLLFGKSAKKPCGRSVFFQLNMIFCMLMPCALTIHYAYTIDYQAQGRYLLPALIPFMAYLIQGMEALSALRFKKLSIPTWLTNVGVVFCFLLIILGTLDMVYFRAMPVYLETGVVM